MSSYYSYLLITPDGLQWDLNESKWQVDVGIPDGFDLPEISHDTQVLYNQPGALLKSVQVQPRVVTITANVVGSCRDELHQVRTALWQSLRWNREGTNPPSYSILRYQANGHTADLHCYFLSDVISGGDGEQHQAVGYKLIAYDPYWYGEARTAEFEPYYNTYPATYIVANVNHAWTTLSGGADAEIYAMRYDAIRQRLYVGGAFTTLGGAGANRVGYWDLVTLTWHAMGTGADATVNALAIDANGDVYAGGAFANIGGVATKGIARWDIDTLTWNAVGGGAVGATYTVTDLVFDSSGNLYAVGDFATMNSVANTLRVAKWSGTAWTALGTGVGVGDAAAIVILAALMTPDNKLLVAGNFTNAGGVANTAAFSRWSGTAWTATGYPCADASDIVMTPNGLVYVASNGAYLYSWNGTSWTAVFTTGGFVQKIFLLKNGSIWMSGFHLAFGQQYNAIWNGTTLERPSIVSSSATFSLAEATDSNDIYYGVGYAVVPNIESITYQGDADAYPIITIYGSGALLRYIRQYETNQRMMFDLAILQGEIATIDLTPLRKSFTSDLRGNLFPLAALLPPSDFASFALQPEPFAPLGVNHIGMFLYTDANTDQTDKNDTGNQLTPYRVTGITFANSDNGKLYVSIIDDTGGFWHIALYSDLARTHLVGHTATYNTNGNKAIVADNTSGLGGTITVNARTAANATIILFTPIAKMDWQDRFLSADSAVAPDRVR
jgi:hypothetical protein